MTKKPAISIEDAWKILGLDPAIVIHTIKSTRNMDRKTAVKKALYHAEKLGRKLSAKYHPDKTPGETTSKEFLLVQQALESIRWYSSDIIEKLGQEKKTVGSIMVKKF